MNTAEINQPQGGWTEYLLNFCHRTDGAKSGETTSGCSQYDYFDTKLDGSRITHVLQKFWYSGVLDPINWNTSLKSLGRLNVRIHVAQVCHTSNAPSSCREAQRKAWQKIQNSERGEKEMALHYTGIMYCLTLCQA